MKSYSEAKTYLEDLDETLGENELELEGVLIGQVAIWEYADRHGVDIEYRETEDIDLYAPDVSQVFDVADIYGETLQMTGTRVRLDNRPETYMDLIWDHPMAEEFLEIMEDEEAEVLDYENMTIYLPPAETLMESKERAGREKDFKDIEKLERVLEA